MTSYPTPRAYYHRSIVNCSHVRSLMSKIDQVASWKKWPFFVMNFYDQIIKFLGLAFQHGEWTMKQHHSYKTTVIWDGMLEF